MMHSRGFTHTSQYGVTSLGVLRVKDIYRRCVVFVERCSKLRRRKRAAPCLVSGFTLVETLVAITILLVSLAGPLTIATKGLSASVFARDQVTAFYLAQEAIEFVRNRRDEYGLRQAGSFIGDFAACTGGNSCTIDTWTSLVGGCGSTCPPLRYNIANGYGYGSGETSRFTRSVSLESITSKEVAITVTMSWTTGLLSKEFSIREHVLDWQQ